VAVSLLLLLFLLPIDLKPPFFNATKPVRIAVTTKQLPMPIPIKIAPVTDNMVSDSGSSVGLDEGRDEGADVGAEDGELVGDDEGAVEGLDEGEEEGAREGVDDGLVDGLVVVVGEEDELDVGTMVGLGVVKSPLSIE
jgi:hypothetical protein